jgi:C_GCAxxG_C_C family probable redox protein
MMAGRTEPTPDAGHVERPTESIAGTVSGEAVAIARAAFLDDANDYGCAEATLVALKSAFDLPDPWSSSEAMALNGGIAWTGGACGAITGAALAIGMLAQRRISDHVRAKRVARELVAALMTEFAERHGSLACRELTGTDLRAPGAHEAFIASGAWRVGCMAQIEFAVARVAALSVPEAWDRAVADLEASSPG